MCEPEPVRLETEPSVSVVIAAFNAEATIERAVGSVLRQTCPASEVIVIDDASTDATRSIVQRLAAAHPCVRLIVSERNGGPARARNVGFRAARSEWLAIHDADDAWCANRLEMMLDAARRHRADIVADNMLLYDAGAEVVTRTGFPVTRGVRAIKPIDVFQQDVQLGAEFGFGLLQPMIRSEFLRAHDLAYDEHLRYGEDMLFLAEMLLVGARGVVIPDPLYVYTTRIGERSGKTSLHSRSIPRFDLIADAMLALKTRYPIVVQPELDRAISKLARRYRVVHDANLAKAERLESGVVAYAIYLSRRPAVLGQVMRQKVRVIMRSLQARRARHHDIALAA